MAGPRRGKVDQRLGQLRDPWLPTGLVIVHDTDDSVAVEEQVIGIVVAMDD